MVAVWVLAAMATSAHALDGTRKGFILGIGFGGGFTDYEFHYIGPPRSGGATQGAAATDFRIGGGITEKFLLYYENRVTWFSKKSVYYGGGVTAFPVGLLGASYYLETKAPSLYVLGSVGTSAIIFPLEDTDILSGAGISGGVGYEFAPKWSVESTLNWGNPERDGLRFDIYSVLFTIVGTWY
jgi:hypothetical protein